MQIVIDIPEEEYKLCRNYKGHLGDHSMMSDAIAKGTPLPKGHKRLIEDNFEVGPVFDEEGNRVGYQYITQEDLNNAPTIVEADKESEE